MTTKALEKKIETLKREVATLKSFVIESVANEDDEGNYKPTFVKRILGAARRKSKGGFEYTGSGSLLQQLRKI